MRRKGTALRAERLQLSPLKSGSYTPPSSDATHGGCCGLGAPALPQRLPAPSAAGAAGLPRRRSRPFPRPELPCPAQPRCCRGEPGAGAAGAPARPRRRRCLLGAAQPGPAPGAASPGPCAAAAGEDGGVWDRPPLLTARVPSFGSSPVSAALRCPKVSQALREKDPEHIQPKDGTSGFVHSSVESEGSNWQ